MDNLTFSELRLASVKRCEKSFHTVEDWSPTDWACAVAGEVGEACNLIKKLKRGEEINPDEIGKELADAVCYLDLLAHRLGLDLGKCVRDKFNEVSSRVDSDIFLKGE
jgi:NTP pyrophosphatase (non-canonical NTP hydrolase)